MFTVGQRVQLTILGESQGLQGRARTRFGRVVIADKWSLVKVKRDGIKQPAWYWVNFWTNAE